MKTEARGGLYDAQLLLVELASGSAIVNEEDTIEVLYYRL